MNPIIILFIGILMIGAFIQVPSGQEWICAIAFSFIIILVELLDAIKGKSA